jgi:uncharacterized protein YlxP (DUF503 family)
MIIGILKLDLFLGGCRSLKDKRQILNSFKKRLRDNFNVSVAEIEYQDKWQRVLFAVVCVGNDKQFVNGLLDRAVGFIRSNPKIMVVDYKLEIL